MRKVHQRLREALDLAREAAESGRTYDPGSRDLLLHCWGFCLALSGHHTGEDDVLFPAVVADHPDLADVVELLRRDHSVLEQLLAEYRTALDRRAAPDALVRHLEGIGAIMESHFGYEERTLLGVLEALVLDVAPEAAYGPLA